MATPGKASQTDDFEGMTLSYLNAVYRTAHYLTHTTEDAEDLTQETYLRAYRAFSQFRGGNLKAWLFTILRHAYIDLYRHRQHEPATLDIEALEDAQGRPGDTEGPASPSAEETVLQGVLSEDLERALRDLPAEWRLVLLLADVEDFSYQEIADLTGMPIGTVMSRLSRGRKRLSQQLKSHARMQKYRKAAE
jgi:RNA polymerase sigma-70 factor (ECF subfamily)